jgi:hypothetical protein
VQPSSKDSRRVLNYSLRYAKNIERKMMNEALLRLAVLAPLSTYRYVGFGSEFFNDFSLFHQALGVRDMISIESDEARIARCEFNLPYKCIELKTGNSAAVLPTLNWSQRNIVWLDYVEKLNRLILEDVNLIASQVRSGSLAAWTVNANPWGGDVDEDTSEKVAQTDWPQRRLSKFQNLFGSRKFPGLNGASLAGWGMAAEFHRLISDEVVRALNDRNASALPKDKIQFRQCFHFRYADGQRMLTVGGVFLNPGDGRSLGKNPFEGLDFIREAEESYELDPPTLTGREVRHLNRLLPSRSKLRKETRWLSADEIEKFRRLYRYYPVFAESEL